MTPVLTISDLRVDFDSEAGAVQAVRGVSLDVEAGRTLAIVGESGSGKSVTAMSVMGLLPDAAQVSGSVRLAGEELLGRSDKDLSRIRGQRISMIFQDPLSSLTPVYTVGAQLVEAVRIHQSISKSAAWQRAQELLDLVGIPDSGRRARSYPHELSGGMRQRVMIAMAIANDPEVIIADEPTTALDVTIAAQILTLLKTAQIETGAALVLITHDLGVVATTADEVAVMYGGRIVERAGVDDLFARPRMPYTVGLLGAMPRVDLQNLGSGEPLTPVEGTPPILIDVVDRCQFEPRCPLAIDSCTAGEPALAPVEEGHLAACVRSNEIDGQGLIDGRPIFPSGDESTKTVMPERVSKGLPSPVLAVSGLRREFPLTSGLLKRRVGTVAAVAGVSFEVRAGETFAIVGESGSGKTTTLTELVDLDQPVGVMSLDGIDPATLTGRERRGLRRSLAMVFQDPAQALDPRFTAYDIIAEPLRALGISKAETSRRVGDLMAKVGLDAAHADRFPTAFSGGQRQRIAIARALALGPKLVVLDEPLSALDVSVQAGVVNLLGDLQRETGVAFLLVAHDLAVVAHIADRIAVMYRGLFVETGTAAEVFSTPSHPYTRALLSAVPVPDPAAQRERRPILLRGEVAGDGDAVEGCSFAGRCPLFAKLGPTEQSRCRDEAPELMLANGSHAYACHFAAHELAADLGGTEQEAPV
ncbi:putative ABC transporter ATP-binding protein [Gordonia effusa NBRC 100432]|uniref:Putative ABC transporter ATP-binding protein n=1 Tax=Gordonia effusa NBRC 100432 TaxID=1077974 RepID=H0QW56_9ACTN|nr:ABC transporter ATP-binding protein [Gordonia effusa]GAB17057.1 putative ABC transporter ATP-binding protein [Gordonia effusa NBRC 100432]